VVLEHVNTGRSPYLVGKWVILRRECFNTGGDRWIDFPLPRKCDMRGEGVELDREETLHNPSTACTCGESLGVTKV